MRIAGICLAAGQSKRMGRHKPSVELAPGVPLGQPAMLALMRLELTMLIAVVRPDDSLSWLPDNGQSPPVIVEVCPDAHLGLSRSIRCAMRVVRSCSVHIDAVMMVLADQPFVSEALLKEWLAAYRDDPSLHFVAGEAKGEPVPPVLWSRRTFSELEKLEGDAGGRHLLRTSALRGKLLSLRDEAGLDVDTFADLSEARSLWAER